MKLEVFQTSISTDIAQKIQVLFRHMFDSDTGEDFLERVNDKKNLLVILAFDDDKPIAFKMGYEKYRGVFYSWLGGVLPSYRKRGIARQLLHKQHELVVQMGYKEIQTVTTGANSAMLMLNIQEGFEIFGSHLGHKDELSVDLRKKLSAR